MRHNMRQIVWYADLALITWLGIFRSIESKLVRLELKDKSILIINSNVKHELTGSEYPNRRQNCVDASSKLGVKSLRYADMAKLDTSKSVSILCLFWLSFLLVMGESPPILLIVKPLQSINHIYPAYCVVVINVHRYVITSASLIKCDTCRPCVWLVCGVCLYTLSTIVIYDGSSTSGVKSANVIRGESSLLKVEPSNIGKSKCVCLGVAFLLNVMGQLLIAYCLHISCQIFLLRIWRKTWCNTQWWQRTNELIVVIGYGRDCIQTCSARYRRDT